MANLRRTKLKAKRSGIDPKQVDKCNSHEDLQKLISKLNKQVAKDEQGE